ncbi:MAG: Hpt domain-containing protein [Sphingopyxis sp.]|nr:Hpt domain-containing protein [Sphingopyxis sp.]
MPNMQLPVVDWTIFSLTRHQLGSSFVRILGYFFEDGLASVEAVEQGMRAGDAAAMAMPAHKLKSESRQFGAERLGQLAEDIEFFARQCIETRQSPDEFIDRVVALRPLFAESMAAIEAESNPLMRRQAGFGRRAAV